MVVEPLNPSDLFDLNLGRALMHDQLIRNGDGRVGVTVKPVSMQTLKTFNPTRYASLSMDNPLPLSDPADCATVPSDNSRSTENGLAWDIYSHVGETCAQILRRTRCATVLRKARKASLYGFGYSQTGGYMYDYINAVQPLVVAQKGKSVHDGYIVGGAAGAFAGVYPINQCEADRRSPTRVDSSRMSACPSCT